MTFPEYLTSCRDRGIHHDAAARESAKSAWDAAICAAQEACFARGTFRHAADISDALSGLHTWHPAETPTPTES